MCSNFGNCAMKEMKWNELNWIALHSFRSLHFQLKVVKKKNRKSNNRATTKTQKKKVKFLAKIKSYTAAVRGTTSTQKKKVKLNNQLDDDQTAAATAAISTEMKRWYAWK